MNMKEVNEDRCREEKWQCNEDDPPWRTYMKLYLENEKRHERDDKFDHRQAAELTRLPDLLNYDSILPSNCYFPLDTFNMSERTRLPDRLNSTEKIRIWRNMKADPQREERMNLPKPVEAERKLWPCVSRDFYEEQRNAKICEKRKLMGLLPCQDLFPDLIDFEENFANFKELGHARLPVICESIEKSQLVDRASGENPGLVDGDYIYSELTSETDENRVYTAVCLRGMKGMHLIELSESRIREKTWKFCFYQAIVALLAKTQFRYKYITSSNIDYIYDHAWMLFIHMGSLNVKKKLHLDDVVVYNYKYFIEIEQISEFKSPKIPNVHWNYLEPEVKRIKTQKRPELMKITEELGWEKIKHQHPPKIMDHSKQIEEFLSKIPENCHNFILRTSKFCLALWKDGNFWYLYNPYRCDNFGYWDDLGNACIMKFTSRNTLNRHIVILLLRAYSYVAPGIKITSEIGKKDSPLILELFKITYKCGKIYNLKLLERKPAAAGRLAKLWKDEEINVLPDDYSGPIEKRFWLKKYDITWTKYANGNRKKPKWHDYYVEEVDKLYSLWGELHPTEKLFSLKNRGNQCCACYIVAAGMSRIIAPEYWTPKTLDTIVICGDRYYTVSRLQREASASTKNEYVTAADMYLLRYFKIGDILFETDVMKAIYGKLYTDESLWKILEQFFLQYSFGILSCENCTVGVFKLSGAYFMIDVNSIGPPVFNLGDGVGYLIRVTSFKKFIISLIMIIGSGEPSNFSLYPVDILNMIDVGL